MSSQTSVALQRKTNVRWYMLALVVLVTCLNYLDRANLAMVAPLMSKEYDLNPAVMGIIFSSFSWAYTFLVPIGGAMIDRVGPRWMYTVSIIGWSMFNAVMGLASSVASLIACRIGMGVFESPGFPLNARIVAAWHPTKERASATSLYNAAQYVAIGLLAPALGWLIQMWGWKSVFYVTGVVGLIIGCVWHIYYRDPKDSTTVNQAELDYISTGGGMGVNTGSKEATTFSWNKVYQLLTFRQVWGLFLGQIGLMTALWFFMTWFPSYLINGKGLTFLKGSTYAAIPFLVAIVGSVLGGRLSDTLLIRGYSNTIARKVPVITGLLLACFVMGANYTDSINLIIIFMSIGFFGQALANAVVHALMTDVAPEGLVGLMCGLVYFISAVAGLVSPVVIGFIVNSTGSFNLALAYVGASALLGAFGYIFVLGKVYRRQIKISA